MGRLALTLGSVTLVLTAAAAGAQAAPPVPTEAVVVPTGQGPCGATARGGSLWIGVYAGQVLRIDPRGRVVARIEVGRSACRLVVGPAAVWVTRDRAAEVVRITRGSGRRLRVRVGSAPFGVLLAAGSLWVSSYDSGTVTRIDPRNGRRLGTVRDRSNPAGLAWCGGRIWVGHGRGATWLTALDARTMKSERADVGAPTPSSPRCVLGDLWVATADSVVRLDARSGAVLARVRLGGTPADLVAAPDGLVWVSDKERSLVFRLDPTGRGIVDSFTAGPGAFALARLGGSIWVTSFAGVDVRRYDP